MKCQLCNTRQATVHLTDIHGSETKEIHLCEKCYTSSELIQGDEKSFDTLVQDFIESLDSNPIEDNVTCPSCGITYADFQKSGLLGCAEDYTVFRSSLNTVLKKVQGRTKHTGKYPQRFSANIDTKEELLLLRKKMNQAIQGELYERAAELRDMIRKLED